MTYQINFTATFHNQPSLTLNAQLYDETGATVGSLITTGIVNLGYGVYSYLATLPDGHVGSFVFWDTGNLYRRFGSSVNPQEAENMDVKTSTRSTFAGGAVASVTGNVGGNVIGSIGSLATQAKADVNAEADTALSDYGALKPTVTGRTLDVNAGGEAGIDLDNTSGTLAKGTDITGFNDLSAAQVNAEADTALSDVGVTTTVTGRIDAAITSRASQASVDTIAGYVDTEVAAIKAKTDNLPSDPADASDIAASFVAIAATLSTITGYIDTEVAAIKAKTDNLPADPADASDIAASFSSVSSTLATIAGYIDTEVAAIKAKTDNLPSDPASTSGLATAHGSGSWATATGFATPTDVTSAQTTITTAISALHNLSTTDIDNRLEAFDPPTKAELDAAQSVITTAITALNNLSAAQVWSYGTRTLTSFGTLIADIWSYVTRTLTGGGGGATIDEIRTVVIEALSSRVVIVDDAIMDSETTGTWDFIIEKGATFQRTLTVTKSVGLFDAGPYTAAMQLRRTLDDDPPVLAMTTDDYLTVAVADDQASLTITILLGADVTADLTAGRVVHDLNLTDSNDVVVRLLPGKAKIIPEVTRPL